MFEASEHERLLIRTPRPALQLGSTSKDTEEEEEEKEGPLVRGVSELTLHSTRCNAPEQGESEEEVEEEEERESR